MNLEKMNLVEMSSQEVNNVKGGIFGLDDLLIGVGLAVVGGIIADWDDFKKGISGN